MDGVRFLGLKEVWLLLSVGVGIVLGCSGCFNNLMIMTKQEIERKKVMMMVMSDILSYSNLKYDYTHSSL